MVRDFFQSFIFSKRAGSLVRRIAWLSVVSICFSISAFLIVLFVMKGMNHGIEKRIVALEPHLTVRVDDLKELKLLESHPAYAYLQQHNLELSLYESQDVVLRSTEGQFRGAIAHGISPQSMVHMQKRLDELNSLKKNREAFLERWSDEEVPEEGEVALGSDLARALRVNEGDYLTVIPPESLLLPPGESPRVDRVRVRKVIYTNLADIDAKYMYYQRGKALMNLQKTSGRRIGIEVWSDHFKNVEQLKTDLQKFDGVSAETWMDRNSDLFFALKLEKLIIGVFLGLAGLLSAISIVGVLSLLLYQKKREIKLLRALGLSARKTVELFTKMGMMLTLTGVFLGTFIGTAVSFYIEKYPLNVLNDVYYDTQVPALVDINYVIVVLLVGILVGFLGSWLPTKKITAWDTFR